MFMKNRCVVLVGGGRWGRVHASVLAALEPRLGRVLWVARHEREPINRFIEGLAPDAPAFEILDSLEAALVRCPDAAIVANAAESHAPTGLALVRAGVPALIEKPFAFDQAEAQSLIEAAQAKRQVLCVGLHLFYARYLHAFRAAWAKRDVATIEIYWFDPASEIRHSELKVPNLRVNKASDIVPHLWSLARVLYPTAEPVLLRAEPTSKGGATVHMTAGWARISAHFTRRARARVRKVIVTFTDARSATLDFTEEPGQVMLDGKRLDTFSNWTNALGPLACEIKAFLESIANPAAAAANPQIAARCVGSVVMADAARFQIEEIEARNILEFRRWTDPDTRISILDNLAPLLFMPGERIRVDDTLLADRVVDEVRRFIGEGTSGRTEATPDMLAERVRRACERSRFVSLLSTGLTRTVVSQRPTAASLES